MTINTKTILSVTAGIAMAASLALPAFAQVNVNADVNANLNGANINANANGGWQGQGNSAFAPGHMMGRPDGGDRGQDTNQGAMRPPMMRPGVVGTVTAVSGNTITINGRTGFGSTTATISYTIDATNATVRKNNATSTIASIAVGDRIFVQGTVSGTNVTATAIIDGVMMGGRGNGGPRGGDASSTPPFMGNGQPVIAGTISVISGNSLTITTTSNITYTVDVTSAKILKGQNTIAISNVAVGDKVLIQGTINGTSVTATTVVDQSGQPGNMNGTTTPPRPAPRGFFGGIGQFFMHLIGF